MKIYLDTSAWNRLLGWAARKSTRYFDHCEILFSSCNLDEIALAGQHRARELADLAWRITNRRQLCDHILLTIREVAAMCKGQEVDIFRNDPKFELVWGKIRRDGHLDDGGLVQKGVNARQARYLGLRPRSTPFHASHGVPRRSAAAPTTQAGAPVHPVWVDDAAEAFERAIEIRPTGQAYSNTGTQNFYAGRYRDAVDAVETSIVCRQKS